MSNKSDNITALATLPGRGITAYTDTGRPLYSDEGIKAMAEQSVSKLPQDATPEQRRYVSECVVALLTAERDTYTGTKTSVSWNGTYIPADVALSALKADAKKAAKEARLAATVRR